MKNILYFTVIVMVGALLGTFLGELLAIWFPAGLIHNLFATELTAGLHPATLDLAVIDLTFGCMFKFNITSVIGILLAAIIYKKLWK